VMFGAVGSILCGDLRIGGKHSKIKRRGNAVEPIMDLGQFARRKIR
jgi:hypothetical protein